MRATSKISAIVFILATTGLIDRVPVVSARPVCSSDSSAATCQGDRLADHWLSRRDHQQHHAQAFRLPGNKGNDGPDVEGPTDGPSGPAARPTPNSDDNLNQSGPVSGTPWGRSSSPKPPAAINPDTDFDLSKVANVENKGCTVHGPTANSKFPGESTYEFQLTDPKLNVENDHLGYIRTNKKEGSITVEESYPDYNDPRPDDQRIHLWETQATAAFHKSDMKPSDVKQLRVVEITEESSLKAIATSRERLGLTGPREKDGFTVKRDSEGTERELFDLNLDQTAFGGNAKSFLRNAPVNGREVKEIRVEQSDLEGLVYVFIVG